MSTEGLTVDSVAELLDLADSRSQSDPLEITVRQLLAYWGAKSRGNRIIRKIEADLAARSLETSPDFTFGHIDNTVRLTRASSVKVKQSPESDDFESNFLRVHTLAAARQKVIQVSPQDSLTKARTLMVLHDYSQLAVTSGPRSLKGAVSWESIGRAELAKTPATVKDALFEAQTVSLHDDLLPLLSSIAAAGFVLALKDDRTLSGVITSADLVIEFGALASPFFLIGEIERRLRQALEEAFQVDELAIVRPPESKREVNAADDLSFGEVVRLLENTERWNKIGWDMDRAATVEQLNEIRKVRNSLMHFSNDLPSAADITMLQNFLRLLKSIVDR